MPLRVALRPIGLRSVKRGGTRAHYAVVWMLFSAYASLRIQALLFSALWHERKSRRAVTSTGFY